MKDSTMTIRIDSDDLAFLKATAENLGMSQSDLIVQMHLWFIMSGAEETLSKAKMQGWRISKHMWPAECTADGEIPNTVQAKIYQTQR